MYVSEFGLTDLVLKEYIRDRATLEKGNFTTTLRNTSHSHQKDTDIFSAPAPEF